MFLNEINVNEMDYVYVAGKYYNPCIIYIYTF